MFEMGNAIIAYLLAIGVLVTIHELGHYAMARAFGVKVLCFSIGFGKPIWQRRFGVDQTEWRLALIPLGGYVRFADEKDGEVLPQDLPRSFGQQAVWKRMLIVAAGPLINFLLAAVVYSGLLMFGVKDYRALIAQPPAHSALEKLGLQELDEIVAIDHKEVRSWQDLSWQILGKPASDETLKLQVRRQSGQISEYSVDWSVLEVDREGGLSALGLSLYQPQGPLLVQSVDAESPAALAGLQKEDRLFSIDGQAILGQTSLQKLLALAKGKPVILGFYRKYQLQTVTLQPEAHITNQGTALEKQVWRLGVRLVMDPAAVAPYQTTLQFPLIFAVERGVERTLTAIKLTLRTLWQLVLGEASWQQVSGPLTIADYAGRSLSQGLVAFLSLLAALSVGLGVMNLLPIPLLDGGHLLYHTVELVQRRPLSEQALLQGQRFGMAVLFLVMGVALYNDLLRYVLR